MSVADQIWNRACFRECKQLRAGDYALGALLRFHSLAMNGGIDHAVECLSKKEMEEAAAGYRYFGFERVASMVSDAPDRFFGLDDYGHEACLASMEIIYTKEIPADSVLADRFQRHYDANPGEYAPVF